MAKEKAKLSPQEQKVADAKRQAEKAEKFVEIARKRMTRVLKAIHNIGNLSNRSSYSYTPDQAQKIVTALSREVAGVQQRFSQTGTTKEQGFDF